MEKKTEITKIVLQLGGKEVSLTVEQCKKLKEVLNEMFGKEIVKEIYKDNYWNWHYRPLGYAGGNSLFGSSLANFKTNATGATYRASDKTLCLAV
jgi:hypothetical protein